MGRKAQRVGRSFEELMEFSHGLYRTRFGVQIERSGIRGVFKPRRVGSKVVSVFVPDPMRSAPDYSGVVWGRPIRFDAKTTEKKRWSLPIQFRHQFENMMAWADAGSFCWFAIEQRPARVLWLLRVLPGDLSAKLPSFAFVDPQDQRLVLRIPQVSGWYDWLPVVASYWITTQELVPGVWARPGQ